MARPKNSDKTNPQAQREQLKLLVGDALSCLRKQIKKADVNTLANFVTKMMPLVLNDDTQTENDVTLEVLVQKAIRVSHRIQDSNAQNITSEEIEEKANQG